MKRFTVAVLLASILPVAGAASSSDESWWRGHAEGWFWYEDPPQEIEEEQEEQSKPEVALPAMPTPAQVPAPSEQAEVGPEPLSVEWMKIHLPKYLNRAIDNPTPENVRAYMILQRVAMDKASRFTEAVQNIVIGDPLLDEYAQFPTGTEFAQTLGRSASDDQDTLLSVLAQKAGIFFFFDSTCAVCGKQAQVLRTIERKYGFSVIAVSLDGRPLPSENEYADFRIDTGQAARLGIQQAPALVLAKPPDEWVVLAYGPASVADLKDRMLRIAGGRGWINQQDIQRTRPAMVQLVDKVDSDRNDDGELSLKEILEIAGGTK